MSKCLCLTLKGTQCTRNAKEGSKYCGTHANCLEKSGNVQKTQKSGEVTMKIPIQTKQTTVKIPIQKKQKSGEVTVKIPIPKKQTPDLGVSLVKVGGFFTNYHTTISSHCYKVLSVKNNGKEVDVSFFPNGTPTTTLLMNSTGKWVEKQQKTDKIIPAWQKKAKKQFENDSIWVYGQCNAGYTKWQYEAGAVPGGKPP